MFFKLHSLSWFTGLPVARCQLWRLEGTRIKCVESSPAPSRSESQATTNFREPQPGITNHVISCSQPVSHTSHSVSQMVLAGGPLNNQLISRLMMPNDDRGWGFWQGLQSLTFRLKMVLNSMLDTMTVSGIRKGVTVINCHCIECFLFQVEDANFCDFWTCACSRWSFVK